MSRLDDFSQKRLREMPSIGDLRRGHREAANRMWLGLLLSTYTRRDIEILRAAGMLDGNDLRALRRLDESFAEHLDRPIAEGGTRCRHCGEEVTDRMRAMVAELNGVSYRWHAARKPCATAAVYAGARAA